MSYTGLSTQGSSSWAGNNDLQNPLGYAGNSFGALKYNTNAMLGWVFGKPTGNEIYMYSDIIYNEQNGSPQGQEYCDIADPSTVLFTELNLAYNIILTTIVSSIMTAGGNTLHSTSLSPTDYKATYAKSDGLLNMSFFPWNPMGILDKTTGNYNVKTYWSGGVVNVNPLRREILFIKLFTFLKISGISLGSYALIKYGMKKYKND